MAYRVTWEDNVLGMPLHEEARAMLIGQASVRRGHQSGTPAA
jgi:hypothetical protein